MTIADRGAAQIALLALRASLEAAHGAADSTCLFLPSRNTIHEEEIVELLARSAKPLGCVALSFKGVVAIGSWSYGSETAEHASHREHAEEAISAFKRLYGPKDSSVIEFRTPGRTTLLAWRDFERWLWDYDIIFGGYSTNEADQLANQQAIAVVEFRRLSAGPRGMIVRGTARD